MASGQSLGESATQQKRVVLAEDDGPSILKIQKAHTKPDKRSTEYILKTGIAGGFAGCAAKTVVCPLDRVKILFQTSNPQFAKYTGSWTGVAKAMRTIYSESGTRGLFRGHSATLLRIFPYAGIKFLAYEQVRAIIVHDPSLETPIRRFLSGAIAGCMSVTLTYPLEVIRVRLAFDTTRNTRTGLIEICKEIYAETTSSQRSSSVTAISAAKAEPLPSVASSKIVAAVEEATTSIAQSIRGKGLSNFYRGFTPTIWGMLPYAGSSFLTHDYAKDWLRNPSIAYWTTLSRPAQEGGTPAQLTVWAQLTAGGFAGFISQTVSYPLEVIRRRMQVGGAIGDGHRLGMAEVMKIILKERGWRGFWVGITIGYVKMIPMSATSFYVYERGKYYLGV